MGMTAVSSAPAIAARRKRAVLLRYGVNKWDSWDIAWDSISYAATNT